MLRVFENTTRQNPTLSKISLTCSTNRSLAMIQEKLYHSRRLNVEIIPKPDHDLRFLFLGSLHDRRATEKLAPDEFASC